ncbi:MAG TPA: carboxylating nicotinate-nucleotide diphosphorylase [Solibacterales bacterium]|nr:carboxylating nicotinate-nucleotide diphosphorylase [Bryobacterales bacterium]
MFDVTHPEVRDAVARALAEDIGPGDLTSALTVPEDRRAVGAFYAREPMVLAGVELLPLIYGLRGGGVEVDLRAASGTAVAAGTPVAEVQGPARRLLECERVALNFLQRLSAVATLASQYVEAVRGTRARILDTRKTTPGLRRLEKMAAAAGGATNHRIGLFDAVLIKNNHIAAAGGVRAALDAARESIVPVEIEVRTLDELHEALACGAQRLLLDNLTPGQAREWVAIVGRRASTEISGGVTLETVRDYAESGADFISVGAITHSARALDLNFRLQWH